jgi:hypothetical protein
MHRAPVVPEPRKTFSPKVRAEVLLKTGGYCAWCKAKIHNGRFEVDHIAELWEGGSNEIGNLQPLCPDCHKEKSAKGRTRNAKAFRQADACLPRDPDEIEPSRLRGRAFDKTLSKGVNGKVKRRRNATPLQTAIKVEMAREGSKREAHGRPHTSIPKSPSPQNKHRRKP